MSNKGVPIASLLPVMIFCLWESWLWLWMLRRNICVTLYLIARKFQLYNGELLRIYSHFEIAKIFFRFKVRFQTKMEQVRRKVARKRKITSLHQCLWRSLIKSHCQRSLQIVMVRQKKHVQCHFLFVVSRLPAFGHMSDLVICKTWEEYQLVVLLDGTVSPTWECI